jgi:nucleoside-diphosphate-sugar epimerase
MYGPRRNVLDWIQQGRVTASSRYVNLIHVEDLAAICILALERGRSGEVYNVTDGQPRRWTDICTVAQERWGVAPQHRDAEERRSGKRITNAKLMREFAYRYRHPDLYAALESLESPAITPFPPRDGPLP